MTDFLTFLSEKGTCCICGKSLKDSKNINLAMLDKIATWLSPAWNNSLLKGTDRRAVAVVCDGCHESNVQTGVVEKVKYAIEIKDGEILLHNVDELKDIEPILDEDKIPGRPGFHPGSMNDKKYVPFVGLN